MKFFDFQLSDLARAAVHDGHIHSWDTGGGKTMAAFTYPLVKCGYSVLDAAAASPPAAHLAPLVAKAGRRLTPAAPVLLIVPGDLHLQTAREGVEKFGVETFPLDHQNTFLRLNRGADGLPRQTEDGRPIIPAGFYLTSYTQLCSNGREPLPDPDKQNPRDIAARWSIPLRRRPEDPNPAAGDAVYNGRNDVPLPVSIEGFYDCREHLWPDAYQRLGVTADTHLSDVAKRYATEQRRIQREMDDAGPHQQAYFAKQLALLDQAHGIVSQLAPVRLPRADETAWDCLTTAQQDWVIRDYVIRWLEPIAASIGRTKLQHRDAAGQWHWFDSEEDLAKFEASHAADPAGQPTVTRPIKCVFSPTLADHAERAFTCIVVDEGVRMKGEDTLIGLGVRQMDAPYRMVLTATPVKNRLPDIFRLAWWAVGGKRKAHPRFPYDGTTADRAEFASQFMMSEVNLTKLAKDAAGGKRPQRARYVKLSPEVCQVHLLWKLFAPIILRRRKADFGVDIVPRVRHALRVPLGREQQRVYHYHLLAPYLDKNGNKAPGAKLQALRIAAADPCSKLLKDFGPLPIQCACVQPRRATPEPTATWAPDEQACIDLTPSGCPTGEPLLVPEGADAADDALADLPDPQCPECSGTGTVVLPHRSETPWTPKLGSVLQLVEDIVGRGEQVLIGAAFHDPLDQLAKLLTEAGVRNVVLDGRTGQQQRGVKAARFKAGRGAAGAEPVALAGVESMSDGHNLFRCNNVVLLAYSWAFDKFKQFLDRVHRLNSQRPVNVYVVLADGTIDAKLESQVNDKSDAQELVLDGRLMGDRPEELSLADLLEIAASEFASLNGKPAVCESSLEREWPARAARLAAAQRAWDIPALPAPAPAATLTATVTETTLTPSPIQPTVTVTIPVTVTPMDSIPLPVKRFDPAHPPTATTFTPPVARPAPAPVVARRTPPPPLSEQIRANIAARQARRQRLAALLANAATPDVG